MPDFTFDTVPLLLAVLVPGFVWRRVQWYLQVDSDTGEDSWLGTLTLSALNFACCSWLIPGLWAATAAFVAAARVSKTAPVMDWWLACGWLAVTLVAPTVLGLTTGYVHRTSRFRSLLQRFGLNIRNPVGTAWDFFFSERSKLGAIWVTATLTDNSVVEGYFAGESLASSKAGERDLYLERHYKRGSHGELEIVPDSAGVWLARDTIKAIELKWIRSKDTADVTDADKRHVSVSQ